MSVEKIPNSPNDRSASTSASLVLRLQGNDPIAWQNFVELFGPLVFHWCNVCRLDAADSADVMQEVLTATSRKIGVFRSRGDGSLRGWIWTITQNKIRDHFRQIENRDLATGGTSANNRLVEYPSHDAAEVLASESDPTLSRESHRFLHRALDQIRSEFSENSWTAFYRSVVENHPTRDIAEELGISMAGVRQAKRRVLRRLRLQLGESK